MILCERADKVCVGDVIGMSPFVGKVLDISHPNNKLTVFSVKLIAHEFHDIGQNILTGARNETQIAILRKGSHE